MLIFHSFKASGSTFSRLPQRLLKSFKETAISLWHLRKSILEGNLYLGPLEIILRTLASGMTLRLPVITWLDFTGLMPVYHMTCRGIWIIRILTISGVKSIRIYIYISYNFIKVKYLFVWFDSLRPINNLSVKQGRVFLGWTSTKLG